MAAKRKEATVQIRGVDKMPNGARFNQLAEDMVCAAMKITDPPTNEQVNYLYHTALVVRDFANAQAAREMAALAYRKAQDASAA